MTDYTASVDAGNGGTNAVIATPKGHKSFYQPSVRAAATGDSLGMGKGAIGEAEVQYIDWNGHRYISGDDVTRISRRQIERHSGSMNRYGNEFHQFLVANSLANLGVKEGAVDLTLFAPPGMYAELKPHIEASFMDKNGAVTIQLKGDKKPREWRYKSATVWPEGIGAAFCFVLDDSGEYVASDVLEGEILVLDIGNHTTDALQFSNGQFNPEALQFATWEHAGVNTHILEPMLRAVKKHGDDFASLTTDDIDRVIRLGSISGDYTLKVAGYEIDLKTTLDKYRERHAEWIANNILDGAFNSLRGIRSLITVGGGAVFTDDYLLKWNPKKVLDRKKYKTAAKVHPVDMNAVGGLRMALMRQKQGKK